MPPNISEFSRVDHPKFRRVIGVIAVSSDEIINPTTKIPSSGHHAPAPARVLHRSQNSPNDDAGGDDLSHDSPDDAMSRPAVAMPCVVLAAVGSGPGGGVIGSVGWTGGSRKKPA